MRGPVDAVPCGLFSNRAPSGVNGHVEPTLPPRRPREKFHGTDTAHPAPPARPLHPCGPRRRARPHRHGSRTDRAQARPAPPTVATAFSEAAAEFGVPRDVL